MSDRDKLILQILREEDLSDMNSIEQGDYHFEYQEEPIQEDEQVLNDGISDEAALKKNMDRIKLKQGSHEGIEIDARYDNLPKFYSYFEENELKRLLMEAGFDILDVFTTEKESSYQTHPYVHAFCKKSLRKFSKEIM